jgi:hypothetical protein
MIVLALISAFAGTVAAGPLAYAADVTISSLKQLDAYAAQNGNHVRMAPGTYYMSDYISLDQIDQRREQGTFQFIRFTGNNNVFDLRGVTIRFSTRLREKLDPPVHTPDFSLVGDNNVLTGLDLINDNNASPNRGDNKKRAHNVLSVSGHGNTVRDCKLVVRGSYPYGYGDLLGFGGKPHQRLEAVDFQKHGGIRVAGDNNRFIGVTILMRALGHAVALQEGPENTLFKDCYVEGRRRRTNDMLAEKSGIAHDMGFRAVEAYGGRIKPDRTRSLSEDAFRIYSAGKVTFINCTAKNMRKGFAVKRGGPAYLENCVSIGNGDGYRIGAADDMLKNCRGDAKYGPLLVAVGGGTLSVDLALMPGESKVKGFRHDDGIAIIAGQTDSKIMITPWQGKERRTPKTINLGFRSTSNLTLRNETTMPLRITNKVRNCTVFSKGPIAENAGSNIRLHKINE